MPLGVRGRGMGLKMQAGAGHAFSTHIASKCNVCTRLGLKESKCIEIGLYQASTESIDRIRLNKIHLKSHTEKIALCHFIKYK